MAEGLAELVEQLKGIDLTDLDNLLRKQQELKESLSGLSVGSDAAKQVQQEMDGIGERVDGLISKLPDFAQRMIKSFLDVKSQAGAAMSALTNFVSSSMGNITGAVGEVMDVIKGVGPLMGLVFTQTGRAMLDPLKDSSEVIRGLFGSTAAEANGAIKSLLTTQNEARRAFLAAGEGIDAADQAALGYTQTLRRMSVATGLSGRELNDANKQLAIMGTEAFTVAEAGLSEFTDTLTARGLTAPAVAITAFRGLGIEATEATQLAKKGFMAFGESSLDAAKTVGIFADAAKQTGYSTLAVVDPIRRASEALAIFGRGSTSAAQMWTTFTKALRDDVPLEQTNQMVQQLTSNLAGMSIQNRAFISMMSGLNQGATALGGGLKMEIAMRTEEGMQRNFEALTESIRKFGGGQVITIEQAANNPQLEMQFQVQRQMLNRLGGITNQEQQNRILEVMQQVERSGMSQLDGSKELKNVFESGMTQQQKELTFLETIARATSLTAGIADEKLTTINDTFKNTPAEMLEFGAATTMMAPGTEMASDEASKAAKKLGTRVYDANLMGQAKEWGNEMVDVSKGILKNGELLLDAIKGAYSPENIKRGETPVTLPASRGLELPPSIIEPSQMSLRTEPTLRTETLKPPSLDDLTRQMMVSAPDVMGNRMETLPEIGGGWATGNAGTPNASVKSTPSDYTITVKLTADSESLDDLLEKVHDRVNHVLKTDVPNMVSRSSTGRNLY